MHLSPFHIREKTLAHGRIGQQRQEHLAATANNQVPDDIDDFGLCERETPASQSDGQEVLCSPVLGLTLGIISL